LSDLLADPSASVAIISAQALLNDGPSDAAIRRLSCALQSDERLVVMLAARTLLLVGDAACPLTGEMRELLAKYQTGDRSSRHHNPYGPPVVGSLRYAIQNCTGELPSR
jgi:hypothetical protein